MSWARSFFEVITLVLATAMVWLGLASSTLADPARVALVIGNSNYENLPKLKNPAADATLIKSVLTTLGFQVVEAVDATQADTHQAIRRFSDAVSQGGEGTIAFVYYAGHGIQTSGINYIIPVDAKITAARDVSLEGVSTGLLLSTLDDARGGTIIIVLDACRDNPFADSVRGISRGLARVDAPNGTLIAYSTAPGRAAQDGIGDNSPFAAALAKNLPLPGLSIEQVFKNVRVSVSLATGGQQVPWEEQSLTTDIVLAGKASIAADSPAPPVAASGGDQTEAERAYLRAVESNTIEAYDEFIRAFPNAPEAKQSLNIIAMLADEKSWRDAEMLNTPMAYRIYLLQHPQGNYVQNANSALAGQQASATPIQPISPVVPDGAPFRMISGYDAYGFDFDIIKNATPEKCQEACSSNTSCKAFTFSKLSARCYLKNGAALLMKNSMADTAYRSELEAGIRYSKLTVLPLTDVTGTNYQSLSQTDFGSCFMACEYSDRCQAFSFIRRARECWLKSDIVARRHSSRIDSAVK